VSTSRPSWCNQCREAAQVLDTLAYHRTLKSWSVRLYVKKETATHTVCLVLVLHVELAQTEIAQSNVTSVVEQDVLGLQVSVNDVEAV